MKDAKEMTKDELVSDEVINYIFDANSISEREKRAFPFLDRAKELKCLQSVRNVIAGVAKDKKMQERAEILAKKARNDVAIQIAEFEVEGTKYSLNVPGWTVDETGIYKNMISSGFIKRACYRPMFPIKVLKNVEDGKEKVKLCYMDGNSKWATRIFDRIIISSGSKINNLATYGVDVNSECSKSLVEYLSDVENNNLGRIERGLSTSKFGWKLYEGKQLFIPYDEQIEFDSNEKFFTLSESLKPKGSYEEWMKLAKKVRANGRKEPFIYLISAFASVLVKPLNCLPFVVNLWTETGKGKTVALMLACSVWANPEEGSYLTDPTSTQTALERRCTALGNLPMMIDDLSKMKDGDNIDFTNMIYFLCGGKGKERSNVDLGVEVVGTWRNCVLTNMERPLATETMRGGAVNRVLDFPSEPGSYFEENGRDKGRETVKILKENYGFAGKEFVEIIKECPTHALKETYEGYITKIKEISEAQGRKKEEKQISPMAILLTTDEIIEQFIFRDGQRLDLEWCVDQLKDCDDVSENQRAYDNLVSDVVANSLTHFGTDCRLEKWGILEGGYAWLLPNAYREIAKRNNFSTTALAGWALKEGLLLHDMDKTRTRLTKKKYDATTGVNANYYVFKIGDCIDSEQEIVPFEK